MIAKQNSREELLALLTNSGATLINPATLLPASDYFDLAGEEFGRRLLLTDGADGSKYCLRPDFTLPIAQQHIKSAGNNSAPQSPAAYGYLGSIFRQRPAGPCEFEQVGLELIAHKDADIALYRVFAFVRDGLNIYNISSPKIRLGSIALFEALLDALDMPDVWRPRLRRRFGSTNAMASLLQRLSGAYEPNLDVEIAEEEPSREQLIKTITKQMLDDGLSLVEGRLPSDIAERYLEKQAMAAARVPKKTIEILRNYLAISAKPEIAIKEVKKLFDQAGLSLDTQLDIFQQQAQELSKFFPDSPIILELGFSPRLHYYTGLVFELSGENNKSLASGGQYDRLLQALGAKTAIAASGGALWVNRLEQEAAKCKGQ